MRRARGAVLCALCFQLVAGAAQAAMVRLVYDDDRSPSVIGATVEHGLVYASVADLADAFKLKKRWMVRSQKLVLYVGRVEAVFTAWNPVVVVDDVPYNLPAPAIIRGGELCAPAEQLVRILDPVTPGGLTWNAADNSFRLSSAVFTVRPGTVEQRRNGTMVTFRVRADLPIEDATSEPNWLQLTILGGQIDARGFRRMALSGAVQQIVTYQYQNSAQISFRVEQGYRYSIQRSENGVWVRVLFWQALPPPAPLSRLGQFVEIDKAQWAINTIIIDPGHGGRDPGTVGPDGIFEKGIVLSVARRLAERLRRNLNVNVVLTRTSDRFVSLRERGRIAIRNNGKLFISIHCNALSDPRIGGVQTYFLSDAQTDEARDVARKENASLAYEQPDEAVRPGEYYDWQDVNEIIAGMTSNRYLQESQELAKLVQTELVRSLSAHDRGVHQAGFYVMKGTLASMPSVLVELGYLTNPSDARKLRQKSYQRQLAEAIYRAVRKFKTKYERQM